MRLLSLAALSSLVAASKLHPQDHHRHHHVRLLKSKHKRHAQEMRHQSGVGVTTGAVCDVTAPTNGAVGDCPTALVKGSTCSPNCNAGYTVSGLASCSTQGTFVPATCNPSPCTASAPANGTTGNCPNPMSNGGACQQHCNSGYTISGMATCVLGVFGSATCSPSPCMAGAPSNGILGSCPSQLPHGASCTPVCNAGYSVSGLSTCTSGTFTSAECVPSPCDSSQPPANGKVGSCKAQLAHGSTCEPKCNSGYSVSGPSSCNLGLLISATCVPSSCSTSAPPSNGAIGNCPGQLTHGGTCSPTCNTGYTVSGFSSCSLGKFVSATCSPSSCTFAAPDNAVAGECPTSLAHGSTCAPKCNAGYTLLPNRLSSCSFGALSSAICTPNSCQATAPVNGIVGSCPSQLTHGGTCLPSCNKGYSVSGVSSCNIGTFSSASCQPSPCTAEAPANGNFGNCTGQLQNGQSCTPTCNTGYVLSGVTSCNMGSLNGAVCNPINCDTAAPENGARGGCTGQLLHGGICAPSCNSGYTLSGLSSCVSGTFSSATCVPSGCSVSAPENGKLGDCKSGSLAHGDQCTPSCNSGFKVSGPTTCSFGAVQASVCQKVVKVTSQNNGNTYCSAYCGYNYNNELAGWQGACCLSATETSGRKISCTQTATTPIKCNCRRNDDIPFGVIPNATDTSFVCPEALVAATTTAAPNATDATNATNATDATAAVAMKKNKKAKK
jgi:hypothetical protein